MPTSASGGPNLAQAEAWMLGAIWMCKGFCSRSTGESGKRLARDGALVEGLESLGEVASRLLEGGHSEGGA